MSNTSLLNEGHFKSYNKYVAYETSNNDAAIVYQYIIDTINKNKLDYEKVLEFDIFDIFENCLVSRSELINILRELKECEFLKDYEISFLINKLFCIIRLDYLQKLMGM